MIAGVGLGIAATVVVAGIFYLGVRFIPDTGDASGDRILGSGRRRAEIRAYLRTIDEPFAEDYDLNGRTVAFYLLDRDVAITFDAQQFFRLESTDTYTVLYEYEMPGHRLGSRLPFDVPEVEPEPDSNRSDPIEAAFGELGLARTADRDDVRDAYRERVKRVHPDQGGDEAEFQRLREAYATASNYCERRDAN